MNYGNQFSPDWASAPGETVADLLSERGLSFTDFAVRMGRSPKEISELISGDHAVTLEVAEKLEAVLGATRNFWLAREAKYRESRDRISRREKTKDEQLWLRELPIREMSQLGWLPTTAGTEERVAACLRFFDVPNVAAWRESNRRIQEMVAFRTSPSFGSKLGAVAAWLRQGEIEGQSIHCDEWTPLRFREQLLEIRALTRQDAPAVFLPKLKELCAQCGVALVVVRSPSGCRASGATRFISSRKALLQLSFRYLSDDHFWFTFFHEAAHLLLHSEKAFFFEGTGSGFVRTQEEEEANAFAADQLIPSQFRAELESLSLTSMAVGRFAKKIGVSPGIVVGQLQHMKRIPHGHRMNNLKVRYGW
jgi:HTH-type transcriptional regulator/antitoxin HigA